ncbi:MAG TPA: hypothetical protein VFX30_02880 [bacterium]|nr:hypothetical protein [bacterium]
MSQNMNAVRSYKLPDLDYASLNTSQREAVLELTAEMNRVRAAVAEDRFESLTTVENALRYLSEKAASLGSALPDSFVSEIRTRAVTRSLERAERHPKTVRQAGRLMDEAKRGLEASDQARYRFFSGRARAFCEKHRLPTDALDRLEERAAVNPFFTAEGAENPEPRNGTRTINPFE